ncbi:hypothetical protein HYFRA_00008705 [Hymenoscyphus fraxineus]|uniref:TPR domain protein n=1 Tax=Hymenoscyphus fraxineus TaxID=746836 RepID=A0A9N9L2I7_9HELO|nr:hypothetical protein HYFRA_00008705 [Hymenoscyphus fraxineus]
MGPQGDSAQAPPATDDYYDLGTYQRTISTLSRDAQIWFNRGLIWGYGFNHEEAVTCFRNVTLTDPTCAMGYWGMAYALGPNYNKPWDFFRGDQLDSLLSQARWAIDKAKENSPSASPIERAIIGTLDHKYPPHSRQLGREFSIWNREYADAMESVYKKFPDDLDVVTLYAESLMNLTPWELWEVRTGQPAPKARTLDAKRVLERALNQNGAFEHPGILHLYIHLMEMSGTPEAALPASDHLGDLVPEAGHLRHMPSHIYVLCGQYKKAIDANSAAIIADEKFRDRNGPYNFYTLYRSHDYHFRIYSAMFAGQSRVAIDTAGQLETCIVELLTREPGRADMLEAFLSSRVHVLIRFGRWQEILDLKIPTDQELYCMSTAMTYYGKGVALAATGRVPEAMKQQELFNLAAKKVGPSRTLFNNKCSDILVIAGAMLNGELEYRRGNFDSAFEYLRKSISLDDALPYEEPWGWMQPTRHAYGALLLEQGRNEEAAAVYSADLGIDDTLPRTFRHAKNVWSLHGYHESLLKLGRTAEAKAIQPELSKALDLADVPIKSSCFCRL